MNYKVEEIKKGVKLHLIKTNKFKTNLFSAFITTPLTKENVTKTALIPKVLKRGSSMFNTQDKISRELEEMYGAELDCGIDKIGDNQVIKFYLEALNDRFLPDEKISDKCVNMLLNVLLNPYTEKGVFSKEYVDGEKENLKQIILGKIDNKARLAMDRCTEEMCKDKPYGLYKFGYVEDINKINENNLFEYYKLLVKNAKIDIYISGDFDIDTMKNIVNENVEIKGINERIPVIAKEEKVEKISEINIINDNMDVTQGKLVIGLSTNEGKKDDIYTALMYNAILGGGSNSKLFQNVREKEGLAYTAGSSYIRTKGIIFIRAGIEIDKYDKAVEVIKEQLQQMKNGDFNDEDINNSRKLLLAGIKNIPEEQDTEITYYLGQELAGTNISIDEYENKINEVSKQAIIDLANKISINTIYFLRN